MKTNIYKIIVILIVTIFLSKIGFTQVAINDDGASPNSNSILDIDISTNNKGVLIPRLTTTERTNMSLAAGDEGLTVYDETNHRFYYWNGSTLAWEELTIQGANWSVLGNAGINAATNFLGTTDAQPLLFKTNGNEIARISSSGNFGINTISPNVKLHIGGASDATYSSGTGLVVIGDISGRNLVFDGNEILSRNNGNPAWLYLQNRGGALAIHHDTDLANHADGKQFIIDEDGKVGVGTEHPASKLYVTENGTTPDIYVASWTTDGDAKLRLCENASGTYYGFEFLYEGANNRLELWSKEYAGNDARRMTWLNNGNVGIGTVAPDNLLHIRGALPYVRFTDTDGGHLWNVGVNGGLTRFQITEINGASLDTRFVIKEGGNVGIGTTVPSYLLDVNGDANITTDLNVDGDTYLNGGAIIGDDASDAISVIGTTQFDEPVTFGVNGGNSGKLDLYSEQGATDFTLSLIPSGSMTANYSLTLPVDAGTSGQVLSTDGSGVLSWVAAGGSGSADYSNGGDNATADRTIGNNDNFDLGIETNGITRIHVQNDGYIGVGTDSPSAKFHVLYSGTVMAQYAGTVACFQQNNTTSDWARMSIIGGDVGASVIDFGDKDKQDIGMLKYDHTDNYIGYFYNGSEILRIEDYGYMGIGRTNPTEVLDINGAIRVGNTSNTNQGAIRWSGTNFEGYDGSNWVSLTASGGNWTLSGTDIYRNTGNVGINTTTPSEKLDVDGNIKLTGEMNRTAQGTANLLPIAYGKIKGSDGTIYSGSGNFSVTRTGTGVYEITITSETYTYTGYTTMVTCNGISLDRIGVTSSDSGKLVVRTRDSSDGSLTNTTFSFLVFKP